MNHTYLKTPSAAHQLTSCNSPAADHQHWSLHSKLRTLRSHMKFHQVNYFKPVADFVAVHMASVQVTCWHLIGIFQLTQHIRSLYVYKSMAHSRLAQKLHTSTAQQRVLSPFPSASHYTTPALQICTSYPMIPLTLDSLIAVWTADRPARLPGA